VYLALTTLSPWSVRRTCRPSVDYTANFVTCMPSPRRNSTSHAHVAPTTAGVAAGVAVMVVPLGKVS
jgi:hypothetical protein